jgi:CheY-like chemotaxis protein
MSEQNPPANVNNETFLPQSTVLIVDDNQQNVELLQAFLESLPVRLVTAADGVEALEKVEQPDSFGHHDAAHERFSGLSQTQGRPQNPRHPNPDGDGAQRTG